MKNHVFLLLSLVLSLTACSSSSSSTNMAGRWVSQQSISGVDYQYILNLSGADSSFSGTLSARVGNFSGSSVNVTGSKFGSSVDLCYTSCITGNLSGRNLTFSNFTDRNISTTTTFTKQ